MATCPSTSIVNVFTWVVPYNLSCNVSSTKIDPLGTFVLFSSSASTSSRIISYPTLSPFVIILEFGANFLIYTPSSNLSWYVDWVLLNNLDEFNAHLHIFL